MTTVEDLHADPWLTPAEVTEQYRICKRILAQMRAERRGPSFRKIGKSVHYRKSVIDAYIQDHIIQTAS